MTEVPVAELGKGTRAWRLLARGVAAPLGRALFRPRLEGAAQIPERGGAIIAFNHDNYVDSLLVVLPTPRPIRFMGAVEVLRWPLVGPLLRLLGVFGVIRGAGDGRALETAAALARAGELVGIFPEGGLVSGPGLGRVRRGAARIALDARVPIVPVAIGGHRLGRRAFVRVGAPLPPVGDVEALTTALREALAQLLEPRAP